MHGKNRQARIERGRRPGSTRCSDNGGGPGIRSWACRAGAVILAIAATLAPMPAPAATAEPPALASPAAQEEAPYLPAAVLDRCRSAIAAPPASDLRVKAAGLLRSRGIARPGAWADAVLKALCANDLPMDPGHVALVFAFIERESSFDAHGRLPNAPEGFRKLGYRLIHDIVAGDAGDIERLMGKALAARVFGTVVGTLRTLGLLREAPLRALFDRHYQRFGWHRVATEWDIEHVVARDLLAIAEETSALGLVLRGTLMVAPAWRERLATGAVLKSVGALQVSPDAVVEWARQDGRDTSEAQARSWLYTLDGGVHFGVRQLRRFVAAYSDNGRLSPAAAAFVAADWRLGLFTCRNAALVQQIGRLAGRPLAIDTPLPSDAVRQRLIGLQLALEPPALAPGATGRSPAAAYAEAMTRWLAQAHQPELVRAPWYARIRSVYQRRFGEVPETGLVPEKRFYTAKTGAYRLSQIAAETRARFVLNCAPLGCAR